MIAPGDAIVVEGLLEHVTYVNEENAWSVVRIALVEGGTAAAVGNLLGARPGDHLRLSGKWEVHPRHGRQFRVETFIPIEPSTLAGIERYLGSGIVRGIGKRMAQRIVARFGIETLRVIDQEGKRLTEVEGIGRVRQGQILAAWQAERGLRDVMVFLQSHGISAAYAVRIHKYYAGHALARVRENPYQLARDIHGIGFPTADRIARSLGIEKDSPQRIEAGVYHVLEEMAEEGHVFAPEARLTERACVLLDVDGAAVAPAIEALIASSELVATPHGDGAERGIYLRGLFLAEEEVARRLAAVMAAPPRAATIDVPRAVLWAEERAGIALDPGQRRAIELSLAAKVLVITGGPGTGKTTVLNAILQILEKKGYRIALAAPTGRAAKRMRETCGREARTIHRLLEYNPRTRGFERSSENPLETDLLILDETSMVDIVLFCHLLRAVPVNAKLVLVGDVDQLPAVGPGNVLRDVVASQAVPVVTLTHVFRQAEESRIVTNAHRVNAGEMPLSYQEPGGGGDFFFIVEEDPERILASLRDIMRERIPQRFGMDPATDVQVLTPMQRGMLGVMNLNAELQALLNPNGAELVRGTRLFREGDRVMQVRNNYDLDLFNGDVGRIAAIDREAKAMEVDFDDRRVRIEPSDQDDLVLAYACSIHKSQGSEYPAVVIPIHTSHYVMLARNLLYTAITRGRRLVVLIGSRRAVGRAVHHNPNIERHTRLAELLRGK